MRKLIIFVCLCIACRDNGGGPAPPDNPPLEMCEPTVEELQLIDLHNEYRKGKGLSAMQRNDKLLAAAQGHAQWMSDNNRMVHINNGTPWERISEAGYKWSSAGENIAAGQRNNNEVMQDWIGSAGHERNIRGVYAEIGVAVASSKVGRRYWCAVFASSGKTSIKDSSTMPEGIER